MTTRFHDTSSDASATAPTEEQPEPRRPDPFEAAARSVLDQMSRQDIEAMLAERTAAEQRRAAERQELQVLEDALREASSRGLTLIDEAEEAYRVALSARDDLVARHQKVLAEIAEANASVAAAADGISSARSQYDRLTAEPRLSLETQLHDRHQKRSCPQPGQQIGPRGFTAAKQWGTPDWAVGKEPAPARETIWTGGTTFDPGLHGPNRK